MQTYLTPTLVAESDTGNRKIKKAAAPVIIYQSRILRDGVAASKSAGQRKKSRRNLDLRVVRFRRNGVAMHSCYAYEPNII